ncbi:MAG: hypothetical protein Q7R65_04545 [bacterium]|nr:hypothetical protein [bacterium]
MYRDLGNLIVIKGDESFAKSFCTLHGTEYTEVKIIGFENLDRQSGVPLEKQFYQNAGVDLTKKWDSFFVERDYEKEQTLFKGAELIGEYVFLHEDKERNYLIDKNKIDKKYKIFVPDPKLTENIFDYCTIIEKAKEIHAIDSSFMFLIDCLKYENPEQKLYVHRYARENEVWKFPILKKNWNILTLAGNRQGKEGRISKLLDKTEILFLGHPFLKRITRKIYRTFGWRTRSQKQGGAV